MKFEPTHVITHFCKEIPVMLVGEEEEWSGAYTREECEREVACNYYMHRRTGRWHYLGQVFNGTVKAIAPKEPPVKSTPALISDQMTVGQLSQMMRDGRVHGLYVTLSPSQLYGVSLFCAKAVVAFAEGTRLELAVLEAFAKAKKRRGDE